MKVRVELLPGVRPLGAEGKFEVEVGRETTLKDLLLKIGFSEGELLALRVWIGGELAGLSRILKEGEEVRVGVPIGGGFAEEFYLL